MFLLGKQAMFGQDPPISLRSTTATRWPALAIAQARFLPASPLPMISKSTCCLSDIVSPQIWRSDEDACFMYDGATEDPLHIRALEKVTGEPTRVPEIVHRDPVETNQNPWSNSRFANCWAGCAHNSPCPKYDPRSPPYRRPAFP